MAFPQSGQERDGLKEHGFGRRLWQNTWICIVGPGVLEYTKEYD